MIAFSPLVSMALAVLLGVLLASGYAYETRVNHNPWWAYDTDLNSIDNNYQYYYPYQQRQQQQQQQQYKRQNYYQWSYPTRDQAKKKKVNNNRWKFSSFNKDRKKDNFNWNNYLPSIDFNKIKMPTIPPVNKPAMSTREWPAYHLLPPIRMISLPKDEPPQP